MCLQGKSDGSSQANSLLDFWSIKLRSGFGVEVLEFWAWDEFFLGRIVTDSLQAGSFTIEPWALLLFIFDSLIE